MCRIYDKQKPDTHGYAMMSMGLSRAYKMAGNPELEEKHLIIAAMTDIKLAVKENEALLTLAVTCIIKEILIGPIIM